MSLDKAMIHVMGLVWLQFEEGIGGHAAYPALIGNPGIGKTSLMVQTFAKDCNVIVSDFAHVPLEEGGGMPQIKEIIIGGKQYAVTDWTLPSILSEILEKHSDRKTILFIDEVDKCSPAHQDLMTSISNGKLRGHELPRKNFAIVFAGNASSRAGSKTISSMLTNRCWMVMTYCDFKVWKEQFALPNLLNSKILSFLSNEKYRKYFTMEEKVNVPWASPRSWTRFATYLTYAEKALGIMPFQDIMTLTEGFVGSDAASDFAAYYKLYNETEMDKVFAGKKAITIPSDFTEQYVYMLAAISEFFNQISQDAKNIDKALDIISQIIIGISKSAAEIGITGIREIVAVDRTIRNKGNSIFLKLRTALKKLDPVVDAKISKELDIL